MITSPVNSFTIPVPKPWGDLHAVPSEVIRKTCSLIFSEEKGPIWFNGLMRVSKSFHALCNWSGNGFSFPLTNEIQFSRMHLSIAVKKNCIESVQGLLKHSEIQADSVNDLKNLLEAIRDGHEKLAESLLSDRRIKK